MLRVRNSRLGASLRNAERKSLSYNELDAIGRGLPRGLPSCFCRPPTYLPWLQPFEHLEI